MSKRMFSYPVICALVGVVSVLVVARVDAATVFSPVDGNVNFLFGDLQGGTLAMFDDNDQGYAGLFINVPVPSSVGIFGPVNSNGDHLATNSLGDSLILSDNDSFILGLNVGGLWLADSSVVAQGANSYTVLFNNGSSVLQVDVQIVPAVIPLPAAAWLFGSGLLGLAGVIRRQGRGQAVQGPDQSGARRPGS